MRDLPESPLEDKLLTNDTSTALPVFTAAATTATITRSEARVAVPSSPELVPMEMEVEMSPKMLPGDVSGGNPASPSSPTDEGKSFKDLALDTVKLGAGLFADSYDLFVIDSVLAILTEVQLANDDSEKARFGFNDNIKGAVAAATSFGAVGGMLLFGFLADRFGRRVLLIATAACVMVGATCCALTQPSDSFPLGSQLVLCRILVGIGIGGEYPLSAAASLETTSEVSLIHRTLRAARLFSMQGVGMVTAATVALVLTGAGVPLAVAWRILLGLGAVPASIAVFVRTRHMKESQQFLQHRASIMSLAIEPVASVWSQLWERRALLGFLSALWFILDVTFYGTGQFRSAIEQQIFESNSSIDSSTPQSRVVHLTGFSLVVALVGLPGYLVSSLYALKRYEVWQLQLLGFFALSILYLVIGVLVDTNAPSWTSLLVFAVTFFVTNLGPNMTTFIVPPLMLPISVRTTGHGIAAACGKLGAAAGGYLLPVLLHTGGLNLVMYACAGVATTGTIVCLLAMRLSDVSQWRREHHVLAPLLNN